MNNSFDLAAIWSQIVYWIGEYGLRILVALCILWIGASLAKKIAELSGRVLERRNVDPTLLPFITGMIRYALLAAVVVAALGQAGINVTSFLAILGAAGLAVGLALKDSLANFAAGVMLLGYRFFRVGDYVTVAGTSGTVRAVGIFHTELTTPDNQNIYVPNGSILGGEIVNVTANENRRLDLTIGIGYGDDIAKAKALLAEIVKADARVLPEPEPTIAVMDLADSSVNIVVRPWVKGADYWTLRFDLLERIKTRFDQEGVSIPFPQRDVHIHQEK